MSNEVIKKLGLNLMGTPQQEVGEEDAQHDGVRYWELDTAAIKVSE